MRPYPQLFLFSLGHGPINQAREFVTVNLIAFEAVVPQKAYIYAADRRVSALILTLDIRIPTYLDVYGRSRIAGIFCFFICLRISLS